MSTTQELVEKLQNVSEWKQIIERHRRITDDPRISYVLQDGTRVHEDEDVIAKLAASLSRALEDAANTASAAALRLSELEAENARMRAALSAAIGYMMNARIDLETGCSKATAIKTISGGIDRARAALAGSGEK